MGEALYFYFLIVSTKDSIDEERVINTVLRWSPTPVVIPKVLVAGLVPGIGNPGQMFHSARPFQVGFLIEFVEQWKEQDSFERQRLLDDPWAFKDFSARLNFQSMLLRDDPNRPRSQREALLHLVFPDTFDGIVSVDHKEIIAKTFAEFVKEPTKDVDFSSYSKSVLPLKPSLALAITSFTHPKFAASGTLTTNRIFGVTLSSGRRRMLARGSSKKKRLTTKSRSAASCRRCAKRCLAAGTIGPMG